MIPRSVKKIIRHGLKLVPPLERQILVSAGYRQLSRGEAELFNLSADGWHSASSARRQEKAYLALLADMHRGAPRADLTVAAEAVSACGLHHPSLLEIGCGNGYYGEILEKLVPGGVAYTGLDYSAAMINRARALYPSKRFMQGDATNLAWPDNAFDIVFNGVSLMHILAYDKALSEAARVARGHVILHCVPVMEDYQTVYLSKYAYGAPVTEIVFSLQELVALGRKNGLTLKRQWDSIPYDVFHIVRHHSRMVTFLFEKEQA